MDQEVSRVANKAALVIIAVVGAAAAAALYFVTRPVEPESTEQVETGAVDVPGGAIGSGAPTGEMQPPIVQEEPHFSEPTVEANDYDVLAQLERDEKKECPWDNSLFATVSACDHHILDVHGGAPNANRTEAIPGAVPLLRYQKIPFLLRVRDESQNPIINQFVEFKRTTGEVVQADYTDSNGCIDFFNLDPGQYRVVIDALPTYSQIDLVYDIQFLPEQVTLYDFSGNPVRMEFMKPYLVDVVMSPPGWSVIQEIVNLGVRAPGPVPISSLESSDALSADKNGYNDLANRISRVVVGVSDGSDITVQELTLIAIWRP